jgi:hypothetical protein
VLTDLAAIASNQPAVLGQDQPFQPEPPFRQGSSKDPPKMVGLSGSGGGASSASILFVWFGWGIGTK